MPSAKRKIDFDKVIGQSCTIKLKTYDKKTRIFNGILTEARWIEKFGDHYHYRLVLRPWFALLDHKADCRVFLDKDAKDVIKEVFTPRPGSTISSSKPPRVTIENSLLCAVPTRATRVSAPSDRTIRHLLFLQALRRNNHGAG